MYSNPETAYDVEYPISFNCWECDAFNEYVDLWEMNTGVSSIYWDYKCVECGAENSGVENA